MKDIEYCGVDALKIASAKPKLNRDSFILFNKYITERYRIHIRKDFEHQAPPFTEDPILKEFRFTNVCREDDRETKWLIDNVVNDDSLCPADKFINIILFRLFNKHETAELIGVPIRPCETEHFDPEEYRQLFNTKRKEDPKYVFFTGAFNTGGMKRALIWYQDKPEKDMCMRVMNFIEYLLNDDIVYKFGNTTDQESVFNLLKSYMGIGEFLAYQMFVDLSYCSEFGWSENEFVIAGPGCKLGMSFLFKDMDGMTHSEALFWLRDNWERLQSKLTEQERFSAQLEMIDKPEQDRTMNLMRLENCFCEFSKYYKTLNEIGRPRKKYVYRG